MNDKFNIIYKILLSFNNNIIKYTFIFLPIFTIISFSSVLFINNLSNSYKNYLKIQYIGVNGILSISSKDDRFLKSLKKQIKSYNNSFKAIKRNKITLKANNFKFQKTISFIVLEKQYLKQKFGKSDIFINNVLYNILPKDKKIALFYNDKKVFLFDKIFFVDTGFLTNEPLIFISSELYKKIFKNSIKFDTIEIDTTIDNIEKIKDVAIKISGKYSSDIYIKNIFAKYKKETASFNEIKKIEHIILAVTFFLLSMILVNSLSMVISFKKKSLYIARLLGIAINDIAIAMVLLIFIYLILSILLSLVFYKIFQIIFIKFVINDFLFLPINYNYIFYIILGIILISIYLYFFIKNKIKKGI